LNHFEIANNPNSVAGTPILQDGEVSLLMLLTYCGKRRRSSLQFAWVATILTAIVAFGL
jgi:hypothetical protein